MRSSAETGKRGGWKQSEGKTGPEPPLRAERAHLGEQLPHGLSILGGDVAVWGDFPTRLLEHGFWHLDSRFVR